MYLGSNPLFPAFLMQVLILLYLTVLYKPGVRQQEMHQGRLSVRARSSRAGAEGACAALPTSPDR